MCIKKDFFAPWALGLGATRRAAMLLLVMMLTATTTAWATTTSTINVGGTDYTLFTGFTATSGTNVTAAAFSYPNMVDGNLDWLSSWHLNGEAQPYYIEFNSDEPIIPKGYIFNTYAADNYKPTDWVLKAKANAGDSWTTLSSKSGQSLADGQEFQYACDNSGNNAYKYFRFEVAESSNNIWLTEIRLYGSIPNVYYTHLTVRDATCTETGIKQDCYQRNDGKYFTDETGATELAESDVIDPMIPHTCEHHDATDVNIEYWQCSMCSKYFSDEAYTTEITEEDTKIYRTITIDEGIRGLVMPSVSPALTGTTITLYVDQLIDTSTLQVNNGSVTLTHNEENGTYTFTVPAADVTVTASILSTYSFTLPANMMIVSATNAVDESGKYISGTVIKFVASAGYEATNVSDGTNTLERDAYGIYTVTVADADINITATTESSNTLYLAGATSDLTAVGGNILIGSTNYTVTIVDGANITLNNATINGGVICAGSAEITLVGTNSVSHSINAGIQIGGSGTTLTIKGDGSLSATGGSAAAGIGLSRTWYDNATAGSVVIESGTITASGNNGIGIGTVGNYMTAHMDGIIIKGGTVSARLGNGYIYPLSSVTIGAIKIYDTIDKVDASTITESVTYMHVENETETDVTANASTYFTIIEDVDRRVITPKDDTDYTITIADDIEHGSIACAATTAKYGEQITITATPDFGYHLSRLVVKDAENNDLASTSNTFFMPKGNVTVSAVFEQGTHGTTEFAWGNFGVDGFVTEASIYDGLTTVNLQQGQSYQILKYDGSSSYSTFLLDNDTYNVTIPYSSGIGTFPAYGNGTNFNNNGESGFYDITMTDAGNGRWNISILKTTSQMDVVLDQTYTGSEITPEPLVIAGSLNLTKGTDYVYSYENNENVGTAKVRATFQGDYASLGYVEKEFTIAPRIYTVSFDANGGSGDAMESMQLTYGGDWATLPTCTYTAPDGKAFKNWNTAADGSGTAYREEEWVKDMTTENDIVLYAQWGKDIAVCSATVPDQTMGGYSYIFYKFESANNDAELAATLGIEVKDGNRVLVLGTDYEFGQVVYASTGEGMPENVGDECLLEIKGKGDYAGSLWAPFTITIPDDGGTWGQLTWAFHAGTLTISGTGAMDAASNYSGYPWLTVASYIKAITIGEGVTTIASEAFAGTSQVNYYSNVLSVSLPSTLETIGDEAFAYCTSLTVTIPTGVTIGANVFNQVGCVAASLQDAGDNTGIIDLMADAMSDNVTLSGRTLYKDGSWNTLTLPFSLSTAQIAANANFAGATLMTMDVTKKNGFDTTDGTLYLWFKTATEIEAGVPYLVKWDKATDYDNNPSAYDISNPVFEGVTVSRTEAQTVESETTGLETVQMVGTYSPVSVTADDKSILFLGDANTLYYSTVDRQIRSCRAYFSVPYINGHAGAKARAFALSFDGEVTTGIIEVSANYNGVTDDAWYSLDGVRLSGKPTQRGMYINKGKKIIVK